MKAVHPHLVSLKKLHWQLPMIMQGGGSKKLTPLTRGTPHGYDGVARGILLLAPTKVSLYRATVAVVATSKKRKTGKLSCTIAIT